MHETINFKAIADAALANAETIIRGFLPNGRVQGREFVALNPRRNDQRPGSFKVNLDSGKWSDFATGDRGGDLVSLYAYVNDVAQGDAARAIAERASFPRKARRGIPVQKKEAQDYSTWEAVAPIPPDAGSPPPHPFDGQPSKMWAYPDAEGKPLFYACRFDKGNGEKVVKPATYWRNGEHKDWQWQALPAPRPLYGLDRLAKSPDAPVMVTEGEKTADAAQVIFPDFVAVTSPGGSNAAKHADWNPLEGRKVVISPDHDEAGKKYADSVAVLAGLAGARSVEQLLWPHDLTIENSEIVDREGEVKTGCDLGDALEEGWTAELVVELQKQKQDLFIPYSIPAIASDEKIKQENEPPRPLQREIPPSAPFPGQALGKLLELVAVGIEEKVQAPFEICAQSLLATATLAVQGYADVLLPTGAVRPISSYFVSVAESGERKTSVDRIALVPVRQHEKTLRNTYEIERQYHENSLLAWDTERKSIVKNKKKYPDKSAIEIALTELGPAPEEPLQPVLTCPEPTFEGLTRLLRYGQPSVGLFSSEGGQFIGGHALNEENRLKTAAGLSSFWDGEPVRRVRQGDGSIVLYGRRVAVHLMVQPDVVAAFFTDPILKAQGLLSRLLVVCPESMAGKRLWKESSSAADEVIHAYEAKLSRIMETSFPLAEGKQNELEPRRLTLSSDAHTLWIGFSDEVEKNIGSKGEWEHIRYFANKLPEHAARLAAVISLVDDFENNTISARYMGYGIQLANFYGGEMLRLAAMGSTDEKLLLAEKLLGWIHTSDKCDEGLVTLPDVYQYGPNRIRDKKTANEILKILEDHGSIEPVQGDRVVNGTRRKNVWRVVREENS